MISKVSNFLIVIITKWFFIKKISGMINLPKKGPYIITANHASYFDHFIILTVLKSSKKQNVYFLTKKEAFDSFLSRKWHQAMGAIPLNRGGTDTSAFKTVIRHLQDGKIICIYPEGTRTPTGKMYEGKQGAIRMAMASNVPIVPIGLESTFDILPRKRLFPRFKKSVVNIGSPIYVRPTKDKNDLKSVQNHLMHELQLLSRCANETLSALPTENELLEKEMLQAAYEWNERGIRQYPNDSLSPGELHHRSIYICNEILKENDEHPMAHFEKARAIGRLGINSKNPLKKIYYMYRGRRNLLLSIKADASFAPSYYGLGVWYTEMPAIFGGNPKKALSFYQKANHLHPEIYIQLGLAKNLIQLGDIEQAKKILFTLLTDTPVRSQVDSRRKIEALAMVMRIDPKFKLEDRMMNLCLQNFQTG